MLSSRLTKGFLLFSFGLTSLIYLLIKFKVYLIPGFIGCETWNDIGANVTSTVAISLGFWYIQDGVTRLLAKDKTKDLERRFLDEAIGLWNTYVLSLEGKHPTETKATPNFIETATAFDIDTWTDDWVTRGAMSGYHTREQLKAGAFRRVQNIVTNLRNLRVEYDPYHGDFSQEFNRTFHRWMRTYREMMDSDNRDPQQAALTLLSVIRRGLLELENVWRSHNRPGEPMKLPERVHKLDKGGAKITRTIIG